MSSLAQRLDSDAEWWEHEPGDRLVGTVTDVDTYYPKPDPETGKAYDPYPTFTVRVDEPGSTERDGEPIPVGAERIFGARRTVARNEVEKKRPQVGDTLGVSYRGIPDGKSYHVYKVLLEQRDAAAAGDEYEQPPIPTDEPEGGESDDGDDLPF